MGTQYCVMVSVYRMERKGYIAAAQHDGEQCKQHWQPSRESPWPLGHRGILWHTGKPRYSMRKRNCKPEIKDLVKQFVQMELRKTVTVTPSERQRWGLPD